MPVILQETQHYSNVVKREFEPQWGYAKKVITYNGTAVSTPIGAVLGAYIASPTATPGAMVGTGNATAGTASAIANQFLQLGTYTVSMLTATTFVVLDPKGASIGTGAAGVAFKANGLTFTVTAGGTPAVAGDTLPIVVGGTVKYKLVEASATDGTQNPSVVVVGDATGRPISTTPVVNTDTKFLVLYRGPSAIADAALSFGASVTAGAVRTAALAALTANSGIDVLTQI